MCWPFKRVPGVLSDSCLSLIDRVLTDFTARCYVGSSSGLGALGLEALCEAGIPHSSGVTCAAEIAPQLLIGSMCVWGQPFFVSLPFLPDSV